MSNLVANLNYKIEDFDLSVNFDTKQHDRLILYGPSGSGKTTILRLLLGLLQPTVGQIKIDNSLIVDTKTQINVPAHQRQIGYVPQNYRLFPHLSVINNVKYGIPKGTDYSEFLDLIIDSLQITDLLHRKVHHLSGGEMQRVAIARALATKPKLLLLDEPSSSLDMELRVSLRTLIKQLHEEFKIPTIIVTHDQQEALALGTQMHVLQNGKFIESGDPNDVLGQPEHLATAAMINVENRFSCTIQYRDPSNGITVCKYNNLSIETPLYHTEIGDTVIIGLKASDIIIATQKPTNISARNIFEVEITDIYNGNSGVMLECVSGESRFISQITQSALNELGIHKSQTAYILFKASSCFMLTP